MARLVRLETWRHRVFDPDDRPSYQSALRWARNGQIPGAILLANVWRVDLDQFEASLHPAAEPESEEPSVSSTLAERLARAGRKAG